MGNYEKKEIKTGILMFRFTKEITDDEVEAWRKDIGELVSKAKDKGACGTILDIIEVESVTMTALDSILEILSDPEELFSDIRMRFAIIGARGYAKRFLREVMPLEPIKLIRARFFHETAEDEAIAWISSMIESADDLPQAVTDKTKEKEPEEAEKDKDTPASEEASKKSKEIPEAEANPKAKTEENKRGEKDSKEKAEEDKTTEKQTSSKESALARLGLKK